MPPVVPSLFKSNEPITGLGFELSYALKNLVLRLNAIDFGEPKFLTTVFPIGAFVSGVAALILGNGQDKFIAPSDFSKALHLLSFIL